MRGLTSNPEGETIVALTRSPMQLDTQAAPFRLKKVDTSFVAGESNLNS